MIDEIEISKNILTVGCNYKNPKGGIAQIMHSYSLYIFKPFKCIINSDGNSFLKKLFVVIKSIFETIFLLCIDRDIKIIHIHTASYNSFTRSSLWIQIGKIFHKKIVMHIHGGAFKEYYKTNPLWIRKALMSCDCIIALSQSWKLFFENEVGCKNVCVVENIIPKPILKTRVSKDRRFHLLFLGLVTEKKGIFDLINVIEQDKEFFEGKLILHIGGNGQINRLLEIIKNRQLENIIHFEGWVTGDKKSELFNQADAFILPSYIEGLPLSILEAMSYAKPIIATNVGGIPEIVKNGSNGYLFSPGDNKKMGDILKKIIQNETLAHKMGEESSKLVEDYLPGSVQTKLIKTYKYILSI